MEMSVETYVSHGRSDGKGNFEITGEHKVGKAVKKEWGMPEDHIAAAIGGGYMNQWSPDFLQVGLGKDHAFARFFFDKKVALDIDDPKSTIATRKRNLLHEHGFGYVCVPPGTPQDVEAVRAIFRAAVTEFEAYDTLHPKEPVYQEIQLQDAMGNPRTVKVRAIDTKVGGGLTVSPDQQTVDLNAQSKRQLSPAEQELETERVRVQTAIKEAAKKGEPFRNPFIKKDGHRTRKYNVVYAH